MVPRVRWQFGGWISVIVLSMFCFSYQALGQIIIEDEPYEQDSAIIIKDGKSVKDPKKAIMLSLIFPGAGQVYNEKVWKVPIIYGGVVTSIYFLEFNNRRYQEFLVALDIIREGVEPNPFPNLNRDGIVRNVNYWRRNRDAMYMVFGGIYALSAIDAFVDAHLSSFDISEDLSFKIEPVMEPILANGTALGIGMKIKF